MVKGPIVTGVIAILALSGVLVAFSQNASPYVTLAQAKKMSGDRLHMAGDILKSSERTDLLHHKIEFDMKDSDGALVHVVYNGDPPNNLQEANKVVAIGGIQGDNFVSSQLLLKCPSKYEPGKSGAVAQN